MLDIYELDDWKFYYYYFIKYMYFIILLNLYILILSKLLDFIQEIRVVIINSR